MAVALTITTSGLHFKLQYVYNINNGLMYFHGTCATNKCGKTAFSQWKRCLGYNFIPFVPRSTFPRFPGLSNKRVRLHP